VKRGGGEMEGERNDPNNVCTCIYLFTIIFLFIHGMHGDSVVEYITYRTYRIYLQEFNM
jgi:hypothetical protein